MMSYKKLSFIEKLALQEIYFKFSKYDWILKILAKALLFNLVLANFIVSTFSKNFNVEKF